MGKRISSIALGAIAIATGIAIGGCGASSHAAQSSGPIVRAAYVTAKLPGYRLAATMTIETPLGSQSMRMRGTFDRQAQSGEMIAAERIAGRQVSFTERYSGLTFYLRAAGIPGLAVVSGGRPWLEFDMSRMLGAMGLGSLPTGTDPSQFLDYLRAVSSETTRVGTANVRGVSTTQYHAVIDLARYPSLVPHSQRANAEHAVATLEAALGGHTMPVEAWVDRSNLVRRIQLGFGECIANQRLRLNMTMDLFDYGPQKPVTLPSAAQARDITPLISAQLSKMHLGCSSS